MPGLAQQGVHFGIQRLPACTSCAPQAEKRLAELVVCKAVAAKIDRPAGIITFGKRQVRGQGTAWEQGEGEGDACTHMLMPPVAGSRGAR